jgi:glycosyltransferase involved in cell wall biosynthesis
MRLLFVNTARGPGGGITSATELARGLAGRGHEITVACHPQSGIFAALRETPGIRVASLPVRGELNPWRIVQLGRIAQRSGADVILADRRKDVKLAIAVSRLGGRNEALPVVHRHGAPSVLRDSRTYRAIWTRLRLLIVNSQFMHAALLEATPWIGSVPIRVIHNGKDPSVYHPRPADRAAARASLGLPSDAFVVCYHGVLQDRKRVDVLIDAIRLVQRDGRVHGLIAGGGPDAAQLRDAAKDLRVTFAGHQEDVPYVLAGADVAVHLSEAEGFSNAVLEAMSCGLPVIASDSTSHPEQVVEGETGFLVPGGDASAVAARIVQLRDDAALRNRLATASRQRVLERFTLDAMLAQYESALQEATREPPAVS